MSSIRRSSLIHKILLLTIAACVIIFSLISAITVFHENEQMFSAARESARRNVERALPGMARDMWNYDVAGLAATMNGLTQSGSIVRAQIVEDGKVLVDISRPESGSGFDQLWSVALMAPGNARKLGDLRIYESYAGTRSLLAESLSLKIAAELIKISSLAAVLLLLVHRQVTRHLKQLALAVEGMMTDLHARALPLRLSRGRQKPDELDSLVEAINRFLVEKARIEDALQQSEASLSEALRIANLGYWEYDLECDEFILNEQYYSLHGWRLAEVGALRVCTTKFLRYFIHTADHAMFMDALYLALAPTAAGQLHQIELRILCKDGDTRWVQTRSRQEPGTSGNKPKLIGATQDITERKIAEQQIDMVAKLTAQKDAAELANQAKSRFLAAASHDLRQPVHALHLFLGTLNGIVLPENARQTLVNVTRCTEAIDEMFVSLLDVSRLDAGLIEPQIRDFPINAVLKRIRHECEPQAAAKRISLHVMPCKAMLRTDQLMVERILRNLVTNAIRYTNTGRILVGCRRGRDSLRLEVIDTGIGIAADQQEKIFGEFYRTETSAHEEQGLGLGLSIVSRLARLLGTSIQLSSTEGRGSRFSIALDRSQAVPDNSAFPVPYCDADSALHGKTVLVVDDEHSILDATRALLEQWGCNVLTAENADEALLLVVDAPEKLDLMICDYRLRHGVRGTDAVMRICDEFNLDIPALLITGDTSPQRMLEFQKSGLPVLHKPLRADEFRLALGTLLRRGSRAKAAAIGVPDLQVP